MNNGELDKISDEEAEIRQFAALSNLLGQEKGQDAFNAVLEVATPDIQKYFEILTQFRVIRIEQAKAEAELLAETDKENATLKYGTEEYKKKLKVIRESAQDFSNKLSIEIRACLIKEGMPDTLINFFEKPEQSESELKKFEEAIKNYLKNNPDQKMLLMLSAHYLLSEVDATGYLKTGSPNQEDVYANKAKAQRICRVLNDMNFMPAKFMLANQFQEDAPDEYHIEKIAMSEAGKMNVECANEGYQPAVVLMAGDFLKWPFVLLNQEDQNNLPSFVPKELESRYLTNLNYVLPELAQQVLDGDPMAVSIVAQFYTDQFEEVAKRFGFTKEKDANGILYAGEAFVLPAHQKVQLEALVERGVKLAEALGDSTLIELINEIASPAGETDQKKASDCYQKAQKLSKHAEEYFKKCVPKEPLDSYLINFKIRQNLIDVSSELQVIKGYLGERKKINPQLEKQEDKNDDKAESISRVKISHDDTQSMLNVNLKQIDTALEDIRKVLEKKTITAQEYRNACLNAAQAVNKLRVEIYYQPHHSGWRQSVNNKIDSLLQKIKPREHKPYMLFLDHEQKVARQAIKIAKEGLKSLGEGSQGELVLTKYLKDTKAQVGREKREALEREKTEKKAEKKTEKKAEKKAGKKIDKPKNK